MARQRQSWVLLRRLARLDTVVVDRYPPMDTVFFGRVVARRLVIRAPVVPDDDVALAPFVPVFGIGLNHVGFELGDQHIALAAIGANDVDDLTGIEIERFPPGFGVAPDDRMKD